MIDQNFNAELVFQEAMQAHQNGKLPEAENLLRQILNHLPDNDGIMTTLGGVLLSSGKVNDALEFFDKAILINPDNIDAKLNRGIALQHLGKADEAFQQISEAAKLAPERADIQFNFANTLLQLQQYPQAIDVLNQVIKLDPKLIQAYYSLAALYSFLEKPDETLETYQQVLVVFPNDLMTLIHIGNLYADLGMIEKAEETYLESQTAHPDHFLPAAALGKFYLDIGKQEEGETSLLKALSLNPNDLNTHILLGNVCKDFGRIDEAEKYYRKALAINPNEQGTIRNLRRILSAKIPYWHFEMLADTERNDAYQAAIEKIVTKESAILDIGTGSGLLSMMAARAGAKRITACELHQRLAETAKEITKANGFENVIEVFSKKSTQLKVGQEIPEEVDIIISEILDVGVLGEGVLPSIRHAVQNLAKPNVQLIPAKTQIHAQLIEIPSRSLVSPIQKISGFDLSLFEQYRIPDEYLKINLKAEKYKNLSAVFPLMDIDFYNLPPAYPDDQPNQIPFEITISEDGILQAIVFWFDLFLDEEIMVSSEVDGALEHWGQALFCFPNPVKVEKGMVIPITMLQSDSVIRFRLGKV